MSTKIPTIADEWAIFSKMVFGSSKPSAIQYRDMRRAFYAGFYSSLIASGEIADMIENEDQAVAAIQSLHQESQDFVAELMRGNA